MERQGGCVCGSVRYTLIGEQITTSICHCNTCRKSVGDSPVTWVIVKRNELHGESLTSYASSETFDEVQHIEPERYVWIEDRVTASEEKLPEFEWDPL